MFMSLIVCGIGGEASTNMQSISYGSTMNIQTKLGIRIKQLRKEKGISQEELAFKAGLHRTYLSDIERGTRNVSIRNIEKIAKALGVTPSKLLET